MTNHTEVILLTGSNLGQKESILAKAREQLADEMGEVVTQSTIYFSEPWGFESTNTFANQILCINTTLQPHDVLEIILQIEKKLGRTRHFKTSPNDYADRVIDIDILFYGSTIMNEPELIIPHPLLHERRFTLIPLSTIRPQLVHPKLQKTVIELLEQLNTTV